jgi:hypothetical protein
LALGLAGGLLAAGEATTRKAAPEENAATIYRRAFQAASGLSEADKSIAARSDSWRMDRATIEVLRKAGPALRLLLQAARRRTCDWGLETLEGLDPFLEELSQARLLGRLACLRARHQIQAGRTAAGIEDLTAALALGRHIGCESLLTGRLMQTAIELSAITTTAHHLMDLKADDLRLLADGLESIPPGGTFPATLRSEGQFVLKSLPPDLPQYDQTARFWKEAEAAADLPPDQFDKKLRALESRVAGHLVAPLIRISLMDAVRRTSAAMLKAAVLVRLDGQERLKAVKDPFGDGPFVYKQLKNGFELQGRLMREGKPVTLTVGPGG